MIFKRDRIIILNWTWMRINCPLLLYNSTLTCKRLKEWIVLKCCFNFANLKRRRKTYESPIGVKLCVNCHQCLIVSDFFLWPFINMKRCCQFHFDLEGFFCLKIKSYGVVCRVGANGTLVVYTVVAWRLILWSRVMATFCCWWWVSRVKGGGGGGG